MNNISIIIVGKIIVVTIIMVEISMTYHVIEIVSTCNNHNKNISTIYSELNNNHNNIKNILITIIKQEMKKL